MSGFAATRTKSHGGGVKSEKLKFVEGLRVLLQLFFPLHSRPTLLLSALRDALALQLPAVLEELTLRPDVKLVHRDGIPDQTCVRWSLQHLPQTRQSGIALSAGRDEGQMSTKWGRQEP